MPEVQQSSLDTADFLHILADHQPFVSIDPSRPSWVRSRRRKLKYLPWEEQAHREGTETLLTSTAERSLSFRKGLTADEMCFFQATATANRRFRSKKALLRLFQQVLSSNLHFLDVFPSKLTHCVCLAVLMTSLLAILVTLPLTSSNLLRKPTGSSKVCVCVQLTLLSSKAGVICLTLVCG